MVETEAITGARLRAAREAAGLSLSAMSARASLSKPLLGMLETGQRRIRPEHVAAYLAVLGPASLLFTETADGEQAAAEWLQRVAASDVGDDTLDCWRRPSTISRRAIRSHRRVSCW